MTESAPDRPPFLAKLLVAGSGIMSLAVAITVPFLAIFLAREMDMAPTTIGLLIGSSVFFSIFAGFLGGTLSDIFGRTRVLLCSMLGVAMSFVGFYLGEHVALMFVFNATLALSTASFSPVGKALLSDLLPVGERVRWFSYQYLVANVGFAVGPLIGVYLGLSGGRTAFLVAAVAYGVYFVLLAGSLRTGRAVVAKPPERTEGTVLSRFLDSARAVATDRRLLCLIIAGLLLESVHLRISALLAQDLDMDFADGARILAIVMATNAITVVVFQLFASKFVMRRDPVTAIVVGGVLMFAGMAGFATATTTWHFVVAMVVFSVGETFIVPSEFAVIDRIAPEDRRGSYFGAQTFSQLGGFVGPYLGGLLLATWNGTVMFFGIGSLALLSAAFYLVVGRRVPGLMRPAPEKEAAGVSG
ncbi:MDR family MFS transporter [Actinophytocola glycyrrhizae]|uniref:MDR family MFS transporter n=1 Tax=Actinophytocola glycyrrhizae TaxID=2044873 RepID=A0ABV9S4R5_9PSEU